VRQKDTTIVMQDRKREEPEPDASSQRKRPETGRFWLQVDRQTKGFFATLEAAEKAGLGIKRNYPKLHVSVYDGVESANTTIELPAA